MSVTRDGSTDRWMSQIRVKDWTGKVIHKKKRGFATKREALLSLKEMLGCGRVVMLPRSKAVKSIRKVFRDGEAVEV